MRPARMLCVGCPARAYHALEDVIRIHGASSEDLCDAIREVICNKNPL